MRDAQRSMPDEIARLHYENVYDEKSLSTFLEHLREYQTRLLAFRHPRDKERARDYLKACRKERFRIQEARSRISGRTARAHYLLNIIGIFQRPDFSPVDKWWEVWHEDVARLRHYQCELLGYRCLSPRPRASVALALSLCKEARKQINHARTVIVALTPRHTMGSATL
ncbi:hypothetical protein [Aeromonas tecta]|uniref:hypothetical protein n=1 Tax=Aeromonas tecta TaxID=324617 RepID=UPI001E5A6301|nr:hypothetical protein [Aeromonas tecta]